MDDLRLFVSALAIPTALYLAASLYQAWVARAKLNRIPTIGPSGILSSYIGAYNLISNARDMVQEGYDKYHGAAFKVPGRISSWMVVVGGPKMIEDLRKATGDQLSARDAANDSMQIDHTIGREIISDPYHIPVIRSTLTRNLAECFPDVQDEIVAAFAEHIPATEAWINISAVPTMMKIACRTSNRLFVGLLLCRNPDYISLNVEFSVDVMNAARTINLFPNILKPIAGRFFSSRETSIKRATRYLGPIIQERLLQEEKYGKDWPGKPNDYLSWLLDVAQGHQRTVRDLTIRILVTNLAAIHTTSMAFSRVLFNLAAYPSYVPALREEVEEAIKEEGVTKASLDKMRKVDSFIKESSRYQGSAVGMMRKVLKDFTFSDGTTIPKGSIIAVATFATHHDEDNYSDPNSFDGFRFANMRDKEVVDSTKHQMVSLSTDYLSFGNGRPACPGRFFVVNELKAFLAHVLLNYDVAFEDGGRRPVDRWYGISAVPDPTAAVMFRKRCP